MNDTRERTTTEDPDHTAIRVLTKEWTRERKRRMRAERRALAYYLAAFVGGIVVGLCSAVVLW